LLILAGKRPGKYELSALPVHASVGINEPDAADKKEREKEMRFGWFASEDSDSVEMLDSSTSLRIC
jgi:hypothetical protein